MASEDAVSFFPTFTRPTGDMVESVPSAIDQVTAGSAIPTISTRASNLRALPFLIVAVPGVTVIPVTEPLSASTNATHCINGDALIISHTCMK